MKELTYKQKQCAFSETQHNIVTLPFEKAENVDIKRLMTCLLIGVLHTKRNVVQKYFTLDLEIIENGIALESEVTK